jgi:hypothetical protein
MAPRDGRRGGNGKAGCNLIVGDTDTLCSIKHDSSELTASNISKYTVGEGAVLYSKSAI